MAVEQAAEMTGQAGEALSGHAAGQAAEQAAPGIHVALSAEQLGTFLGIPITNTLISTWVIVFALIFIGVLALLQKYKAKKIFSKNYAPTVAVIVPAYNEEKVINETIRSLLAANHTEKYEIIVVDDGSTDDTYRTVYDAYHDTPSLRVFHRENSGKPGAINF